jgi:hypothetical protein
MGKLLQVADSFNSGTLKHTELHMLSPVVAAAAAAAAAAATVLERICRMQTRSTQRQARRPKVPSTSGPQTK